MRERLIPIKAAFRNTIEQRFSQLKVQFKCRKGTRHDAVLLATADLLRCPEAKPLALLWQVYEVKQINLKSPLNLIGKALATCLMLGFYEELLPRWTARHKRHIKLHDVQFQLCQYSRDTSDAAKLERFRNAHSNGRTSARDCPSHDPWRGRGVCDMLFNESRLL